VTRFTVTPEAIPRLRSDLQAVRDRIRNLIEAGRHPLWMGPLGSDPVSATFAQLHNHNAEVAIARAIDFAHQLQDVINTLDQQAKAYGITEDANTADIKHLNGPA
jgi:hypothetical protein